MEGCCLRICGQRVFTEVAALIFEDLTLAYESEAKERRLPATVEKLAFVGLQQRLIREGEIEAILGATRVRTQGSPSQIL